MNDFPGTGRPEDESAGDGLDSTSFDPLLTPFETVQQPATRPLDFDDSLYLGASSTQAAASTFADDGLGWELPASAVTRPEAGAPAWYPDRYRQPYAQRMTELQQRLHAETIVIPQRERRWVVTLRELAETLLLAALIFLAVRASFQNFRVEGASMVPSLEDGEYLIVNKLAYAQMDFGVFNFLPGYDAGDDSVQHLWGAPQRGDVIVFRAPTNPDRDFIKRIIGLPGDTVEIDQATNEVKVNGDVLEEPYINNPTSCNTACTVEVPEKGSEEALAECGSESCYFVMGDNRQNSSDSRQGWLVPEENIVGKALITYWHHGEPEFDLAPNHDVDLTDEANAEE